MLAKKNKKDLLQSLAGAGSLLPLCREFGEEKLLQQVIKDRGTNQGNSEGLREGAEGRKYLASVGTFKQRGRYTDRTAQSALSYGTSRFNKRRN